MAVVVYPVEGVRFNHANIPMAPLEVDAATAARLVRTGGFTRTKPKGDQPEPVPYEADETLDFYDNPRSDDHDAVVHGREDAQAVPIAAEPSEPEEK